MMRWQKIALAAAAIIVPALSCGQRSLVLLDVKASPAFSDASTLLDVQLSLTANRDLTTRFPQIRLTTDTPYEIGMYLPSDMTGTVTFDAQVDNGRCVIGTGTAVANGVQSGETSQPIQLIINPTPACVPIGDGGPGGSGTTGSAGAGGMTGAGGTGPGTAGAGGTGTTGSAGAGGTTGAGGVSGSAGRGGAGGAAGISGTAGAGGAVGVGGASGMSGRGGTTGAAGAGGVSGVGGISGMGGRGGTTGVAGAGGVSGVGGSTGVGGVSGKGGTSGPGVGGSTGVGGAVGVGGSGGGGGVTGAGGSGVGGSGVGGATGAGGSVSACGPNCQPPFMCNPATGACTCSESLSQACTRANIPCGYVIDNCGQQQFCPCQFANAVCDTSTNTCFTTCTTGVGGIVTSAMICPPPPAAN